MNAPKAQPVGELHLSKLDAAKRQLETAITLYFHFGESVSIHTLATASLQILRDLMVNRGIPVPGEHAIDRFPENAKDIRRAFRKAQNFFKHADSDPAATLVFRPLCNEFFLIEAVENYHELTAERPPIMKAFQLCFKLRYPDVFVIPETDKDRLRVAAGHFAPSERTLFFTLLVPQLMGGGSSHPPQ